MTVTPWVVPSRIIFENVVCELFPANNAEKALDIGCLVEIVNNFVMHCEYHKTRWKDGPRTPGKGWFQLGFTV